MDEVSSQACTPAYFRPDYTGASNGRLFIDDHVEDQGTAIDRGIQGNKSFREFDRQHGHCQNRCVVSGATVQGVVEQGGTWSNIIGGICQCIANTIAIVFLSFYQQRLIQIP